MKKRVAYMFVFDGYSDWEPSLATAGLQKFTDFSVRTFSKDGQPVRSMGNLQVVPELSMERVMANDVDLLILPGGDAWDRGENKEIIPLLDELLRQNRMVAAICGATGFLAENGYLEEVRHTSNNLDQYLHKVAPHYHGDDHYVKEHVVKDGNLITANGTAITEFANTIFEHFGLFEDYEDLAFWFGFFRKPELVLT